MSEEVRFSIGKLMAQQSVEQITQMGTGLVDQFIPGKIEEWSRQVYQGTGKQIVEMLKDTVYKGVFIKAMEDIVAYYAYQAYIKGQQASELIEVYVKIYDQMVSQISRLLPIATQSPLCKKYRQIV